MVSSTAVFVVVSILLLLGFATVSGLPYPSTSCPTGWTWFEPTDECFFVWPSDDHNTSYKVRLTYPEAQAHCAAHAAEVPIVHTAEKQTFLLNVINPTSGRMVWLGLQQNPANRLTHEWLTNRGRLFDNYFDWDARRNMPSVESCVALHALGAPVKRIVGGNAQMVTVDCFQRLAVACARQRILPQIGLVNSTDSGVVDHVLGDPLRLVFHGHRIPYGTKVTLQTANEYFFATAPPGSPTNCTKIMALNGPSTAVTLVNQSWESFYHPSCANSTCEASVFELPADTPFQLGAKYSFCFFLPLPHPFTEPRDDVEYRLNLLPNVFLEVIQPYEDHLREVCTRHQDSVEAHVRSGRDDTHRDVYRPFFFSARHEAP